MPRGIYYETKANTTALRAQETEFSTEVRSIWGDLPINSIREVALALLVAAADESLNGEFCGALFIWLWAKRPTIV